MNEPSVGEVRAGDAGAGPDRSAGGRRESRTLAVRIEGGATGASRAIGAHLVSVAARLRPRSDSVAKPIAEAGAYLRDSDVRHIGADVTDLIRHHPGPSLAVGVGVGFAIGLLLAR